MFYSLFHVFPTMHHWWAATKCSVGESDCKVKIKLYQQVQKLAKTTEVVLLDKEVLGLRSHASKIHHIVF